MSKVRRFFKLVGYESKRVLRNRSVSFLLVAFSLILLFVVFAVQSAKPDYTIAVFTDGVRVEETTAYRETSSVIHNHLIEVSSEEMGIDLIRERKAEFFFKFIRGASDDHVQMVLYYDESNRLARGLAYDVREKAQVEAYKAIVDLLEEYGVTLDQTYFEPVSIQPITKVFTYDQLAFVMEIAVCVALILMLGLAYSIARDRETSVNKNLGYLPIGKHEYLFSKLFTYFILGMVEMLVVLIFGAILMKIEFHINFLLVWLASSCFVMASLSLGLLCSTMKSQISSAFLDILVVLVPVFLSLLIVISSKPMIVRILCYCFPIIPFMQLAEGMIYNGVVIWWTIPILFVEAVVFYIPAYFRIWKKE